MSPSGFSNHQAYYWCEILLSLAVEPWEAWEAGGRQVHVTVGDGVKSS